MVAKLINQDQVTGGLRVVTEVLNPVVREHMAKAYGGRWQEQFDRRHPRNGMGKEHLGDLGYLVWVLTKEERAFRGKLPGAVFSLAHRVRESRNLTSHDQLNDLDPATAKAALTTMAEFVTHLGQPGRANEIRQLAGRVRASAPNAPHQVRPTPKRRKAKPAKPREQQRAKPSRGRPVVQFKISCGAVVALAVIGAAVAWVFLSPKKPDPYEGAFKDVKVGARLNTGHVEMSDGYHLELLAKPLKPVEGGYDGDLAFSGTRLTAPDGHLVILTRKERLGYATCRSATRYVASAEPAKGMRLCVTTDRGVVAGVAVKALPRQGGNTFLSVDVAVWKGPKT
ncbi:hypothetical protein GCM10027589_43900 [Actinocorallia lasiicapitis]